MLLLGQWAAVASLFLTPLNKPATNIALLLAVLGAMLGSDVHRRFRAAIRHPVAQGALLWFAVVAVAVLRSWSQGALRGFPGSPVLALAYPLVFAALLTDARWRRRGLVAFFVSVTLVMLVSYGMALDLVPQGKWAEREGPAFHNTVFKEYTQQGLMTVLLMAMALAAWRMPGSRGRRAWLGLLAVLALCNVFLLLQSRTAPLAALPVLAYFLWQLCRRAWMRALLLLLLPLVLVGGAVAWKGVPEVAAHRVLELPHQLLAGVAAREATSNGIRIELWRQSLPIIAAAPVFGHGFGQWLPLYTDRIAHLPEADLFRMGHPHQEALLILSEEGVAGLLVYVALLVALARYVGRLEPPLRDFYRALLLLYVAAGLVNCLWADFTHRHVFILLLACLPPAPPAPAAPAAPAAPGSRNPVPTA